MDLIEHDRRHVSKREEGNVAVQLEHQGADRVFYEYASDAYALFLAGDDAAGEALNNRLEEAFRQRCADAAVNGARRSPGGMLRWRKYRR